MNITFVVTQKTAAPTKAQLHRFDFSKKKTSDILLCNTSARNPMSVGSKNKFVIWDKLKEESWK